MNKNRGIIFGASDTGRRIYKDIKNDIEIVAFVDDDKRKWGQKIDGIEIKSPVAINTIQYDLIYVGVLTYYVYVMDLLHGMGISDSKIIDKYVAVPIYSRIEFLKSIRKMFDEKNICTEGAVAELGVYQGDFAKEINRVFYDKKCYLFDTFQGFAITDCIEEINRGYTLENKDGYFSNTTEKLVMGKMEHPEMCYICKGFFPESAQNVEDRFCFVNLDADLYAPTLAGLEYFWPRMVSGGIVLVHDYFSKAFKGAKEAVREFCDKQKISYIPIGDTLSVAITKN